MYAICAGIGFIPAPQGIAQGIMIFFSLVFFLPPAILFHRATGKKDKETFKILRNLSLTWLITATVALCINILSVGASALVGNILYYILILVTAPMVCGQFWVMSLFLWACLLIASWTKLKQGRPKNHDPWPPIWRPLSLFFGLHNTL